MIDIVRVNATMGADLVRRLDAFAAERLEDRSTAIRQLVDFGLRELRLQDALEAFRGGRVSLREFARSLDVDVWAAHDLLRAKGVAVGQGNRAETAANTRAAIEALRPR